MSDNIDLVRGGYQDFLDGNFDSLFGRFAEEFRFTVAGAPDVPYAGTFTTKERLAQFFQELDQQVTFSLFEPREYFVNGDRVVALGRYEGEVKKNGRRWGADWAMVWTVRDGKVISMEERVDPSSLKAGFAG
jgi:ketosteroid isomerase-like protein